MTILAGGACRPIRCHLRPMKTLCWLLCSCLVFGAACRRKREAAPVATETPAPAVASSPDAPKAAPTPAAAPGTPPAAATAESINVQHFGQLSKALLTFRRDKQRAPKDWQELIATGYLKQMPTAPPGKAYVFNRQSLDVVMVNQ